MIRLSVNVNKIATLRNSRGGRVPSVIEAVQVCLDAGARGITVHPRLDERHITRADVADIASLLVERHARRDGIEFNIEGDPRPDWIERVLETRPDQCTLVPVVPGEITSQAGWVPGPAFDAIARVIATLRAAGIRVSVFVDPDARAIRHAAGVGADRIELYTEPFAKACARGAREGQESFRAYAAAAELAHELGLGVNAGHDLDLDNLPLFRTLPFLDEVSIGHALISRAVFMGLDHVVREYLAMLDAI